jgi:pimeloyl-ACP methyl ester carboxylesterase
MLHGLGGSTASWDPIADALVAGGRELVLVDLPGFGSTPPLPGTPTIAALTDAVGAFLREEDLLGVDVVGSSMGARIALELVRRGEAGACVALDPGGFWKPGQLRVFSVSVRASILLVRVLQPLMPFLTGNPVTRTLLFAQFSARPWRLRREVVLPEMRSFKASPAIYATLTELVGGPTQEGMPAGTATAPIVLGWGRQDRVTFPSQARVAAERFPDARVHWFEHCGHFPQWDRPEEAAEVILATVGAG